MTNEKDDAKKEVDGKRNQPIIYMRVFESSKCTFLGIVRLSTPTPTKTSTHSAKLAMNERASAVTALASAG